MLLLKGFFLAASLIQLSHCYSTGAGTEACVNMLPAHGPQPQTSPPPYTVTTSVASVSPGQTVTITIARTSEAVFLRGFMVQGQNPAGTPVGEFSLTTGMETMNCTVSHQRQNTLKHRCKRVDCDCLGSTDNPWTCRF